jgi:glucosamine--fructose-6-phosphate aminotransferase (isomerizing)
MCGIIGYLGPKEVVPILIDGLRRLEYRGYDSAGVAVVRNGQIERRRSAGKLINLEQAIDTQPLEGLYGVGHTRWATHGRPTEENAHPHQDCTGKIVVVHNGIIENYLDLKHELQKRGHKFVTETDTEIIAHLIEQEMDPKKGSGGVFQPVGEGKPLPTPFSLEDAARRALLQMRGLFAFVAISTEDPEKIIAVRNGPPIVVGIGENEFFVASDTPAILSHTRDVVFLGDEEMAVITRRGVEFTNFAGTPVSKATQRVLWDPIMAEKSGYRHFMLKEIFEQPRAAEETLLGRFSIDTGRVFLEEIAITEADMRGINKVALIACGTSWHAALVGKFLIERFAGLPVEVDYGSEYRYRDFIVDTHTLVVIITQSGETADTLAALREARKKGARSLAICNVVGSMATRESEGTIHTHAGPEIGVASTKAFTSQLVALNLLALFLGQMKGSLSEADAKQHLNGLVQLPKQMEHALKASAVVEEVAGRYFGRSDFLYLGRGINYPIALEGALKLKEISYIHAEGYPAGEMKHGPIALIDSNMPVVSIAPNDHVFEKMLGNIQEVKARGGSVIAITTEGHDTLKKVLDPAQDAIISLPRVPEMLSPIVMVLPLQMLAYHIAVRRGCDVDQPRNLAKSVTVE